MKRYPGLIAGFLIAFFAGTAGYFLGTGIFPTKAGEAASGADGMRKAERKILYYRNPMGLPDTSPVPKKDPMGMDYIPVYDGEDTEPSGQIRIGVEKIQKLGVRTEAVRKRVLEHTVRAAGRVESDERRIYAVAPKFEGYVERLHVAITGQAVEKGQALFDAYSPELVSAQREYAIAARGFESLKDADHASRSGMQQLAEASLRRLRNWDVSERQIRALARSGEIRRAMTFHSPIAGVVIEKKALPGMRFMPGETLFQITDLSSVWLIADIAEQDIGRVSIGGAATVRADAYPDKVFEGKIAYIYPVLNAATRTARVRFELDNPGLLLKPSMFAQAELKSASNNAVLSIPASAVIDSGTRQIVFVDREEGRFAPREIRTGQQAGDYVEIIDGLGEGERVVVSANFLIDAESNLKAAISGFTASGPSGEGAAAGKNAIHTATGRIDLVDSAEKAVTIEHAPVASLNWPGMTMEFKLADAALLEKIRPGDKVVFEFTERGSGEWVITSLRSSSGASASPNDAPHAGH